MSRDIYGDARIYDILFGEPVSPDEIRFYTALVRQYGEPVLELACGTGRITIPLAQKGFKIQGLDISTTMIERAKEKAKEVSVSIQWHLADMRDFSLGEKFGLIFIPHQSFQHLYSKQDVAECLWSVRKHLKPEGVFLIQVFNPYLPLLAADPSVKRRTSKEFYLDTLTGERFYAEFQNKYDVGTQIMDSVYFYHSDSDQNEKSFNLKMRQFFPQEIDALIEYNGFEIVGKYGDNKFTPFSHEPSYQNILCKIRTSATQSDL